MKHHISIKKAEANVGAFDFSGNLDAPAGKHGFVQAKDGHLWFEDGTRARFIGFNMATRSNTPDHEAAEKLARRFASMGVNLIRLHAADAPIGEEACSWSSAPDCALLDYANGTSSIFTKEGRDRFDYFFAKLKEQGIYLHIDLIVARQFMEADKLDYPGGAPSCCKRYPMYNKRMIELEKEYANELLCHVNPYTGLAMINDPAVMTVQINNEESAIKGTMETDPMPHMQPYRDEVNKEFSDFLLKKYESQDAIKRAWTKDGLCTLAEDEDVENGTVKVLPGGFYQPNNDPKVNAWDAFDSPARYADFMEFGVEKNRSFYQMMKAYLCKIGVKVPINTSNLVAGPADVYGHTDADIMENNCYFNHPIMPCSNQTYMVAGPTEYVTADPVIMQQYVGSMATTLTSFGSVAATAGKPFLVSEWNEYGLHEFHSTAFMSMVCYALLNDWDALVVYNYHTSEKIDDQPDDEILSTFDAYNDPALILQFGIMSTAFIKGLISPSPVKAEVAVTKEDLTTFPAFSDMSNMLLSYITGVRNNFIYDKPYDGDADLVVNKGLFNKGDLSKAKHAVYYAWNDEENVWKTKSDRLTELAEGLTEIAPGIFLDGQKLVIQNINALASMGNYTEFLKTLDSVMKIWGILPQGTGFIDGKYISATGELTLDPHALAFKANSKRLGYFSGDPKDKMIRLSDDIVVSSDNERISVGLIGLDDEDLGRTTRFAMTAIGKTGTDETIYSPGPEYMGMTFTMVQQKGRLYMESLKGQLMVAAKEASLKCLDVYGNEIAELQGEKGGNLVVFRLDGNLPCAMYELNIVR